MQELTISRDVEIKMQMRWNWQVLCDNKFKENIDENQYDQDKELKKKNYRKAYFILRKIKSWI